MSNHDNGTLDGASVQGTNPFASSVPSTFEERYADKINAQAVEEDDENENDGGDLEQRVSELESLVESLATVVVVLERRAGE